MAQPSQENLYHKRLRINNTAALVACKLRVIFLRILILILVLVLSSSVDSLDSYLDVYEEEYINRVFKKTTCIIFKVTLGNYNGNDDIRVNGLLFINNRAISFNSIQERGDNKKYIYKRFEELQKINNKTNCWYNIDKPSSTYSPVFEDISQKRELWLGFVEYWIIMSSIIGFIIIVSMLICLFTVIYININAKKIRDTGGDSNISFIRGGGIQMGSLRVLRTHGMSVRIQPSSVRIRSARVMSVI